jgi:putative PEP-CTERM system TPR-repeat lipoprotein
MIRIYIKPVHLRIMMKIYFLVVATFILLVSGCSKETIKDQLVNAQSSIKAQDFTKAKILLKGILKDSPTNIQARSLLAGVYNKQGSFLDAEKEWDKAIHDGIEISSIIIPYFETLYGLNDSLHIIKMWKENADKLDKNIKSYTAPITALSLMKLNENNKGQQLLLESVNWAKESKDDDSVIISTALQAAFSKKNTTDKINSLINACKTVPTHWIVCLLAANVQFSNKDYTEAAVSLEHVVNLLPDFYPPKILLAESYLKSNNEEKASFYLNALLNKFPHQPYINQLKALYGIQMNDFQLAKTHIEITLAQKFTSPETKLIAGLANYQLENYEQALGYFISLKYIFKNNDFIQKILVATQLKLGNTSLIYNELSQVELTSNNTQVIAMAGIELLKSGDIDSSSNLLSKIDTSEIVNPILLGNVGIAKIQGGNNSGVDDIEALFNNIVKDDNSAENINKTKYLLISSFITTKQFNRAIKQIDDWIKPNPEQIENHLLKANVLKLIKPVNRKDISDTYNKVLKLEKHNLAANLYFAALAYKDENYATAIDYYENAITPPYNNLAALQGFFLTHKNLNQERKALLKIEDWLKDHKINPKHSLLLAQIYLIADEAQKTIALLESTLFEKDNLERIKKNLLADAYFSLNDYSKAITVYDELLKSQTTPNLQLLSKKLYALEKSNKIIEAVNSLENLSQLNPENIQVKTLLAHFHALTSKPNEALNFINSLTESQQKNSMILSIKGKALYKQKKYQQALPLLVNDYQLSKNARVAAFIFDSQIKLDKITEALDKMESHLLAHPNDIINRELYASELVKHSPNEAIEQYKMIIKRDSNNVVILNNLAWYLYEQNKLDEAFNYAKKAKKLAPDNANVTDTYNKIDIALNSKH